MLLYSASKFSTYHLFQNRLLDKDKPTASPQSMCSICVDLTKIPHIVAWNMLQEEMPESWIWGNFLIILTSQKAFLASRQTQHMFKSLNLGKNLQLKILLNKAKPLIVMAVFKISVQPKVHKYILILSHSTVLKLDSSLEPKISWSEWFVGVCYTCVRLSSTCNTILLLVTQEPRRYFSCQSWCH